MKIFKKFIAFVLIAIFALAFASCQAKVTGTVTAANTTAPAKKVLVMCTSADFPPYEYYDNGKIVGIDAEIAALIANELGMELKIENTDFKSIITSVSSGKSDMAMSGLSITEDRKKNVSFSTPYTTATQVIIVKSDSNIATPDDLNGKKIGVQLGTTGDIYAADIKDVKLERFTKGQQAIQSLVQGKLDAVIIDNEPAKVFVEKNAGLKIASEKFAVEDYAIAVGKNNTELLNKINAALDKLTKNGEIKKVIDKYIPAK